jgi:hypothetical protein
MRSYYAREYAEAESRSRRQVHDLWKAFGIRR